VALSNPRVRDDIVQGNTIIMNVKRAYETGVYSWYSYTCITHIHQALYMAIIDASIIQ